MDIRPYKFVKFVKNSIDYLYKKVPLLVFECLRHQQRKDLVEERPRSELSCIECKLPQCTLPHLRRTVLYLE